MEQKRSAVLDRQRCTMLRTDGMNVKSYLMILSLLQYQLQLPARHRLDTVADDEMKG